MPFPCHAVPLRDYIVSFPFYVHSGAVFDSHMQCRARAMPRPCRSESDISRPLHSAEWVWHGMCELASDVQRRYVGTCTGSASSGYHAEFHEGCYQKHTNKCRTSSSDNSGYHADFHEGHGTVGEWRRRGMAWVNWRGTAWHGRGMVATWRVWISLKS
jgi:hypothetical protein